MGQSTTTINTVTKTVKTLKLTGNDIFELLCESKKYGQLFQSKGPYAVWAVVPDSGDWSDEELIIGEDSLLNVKQTQTLETEEVL